MNNRLKNVRDFTLILGAFSLIGLVLINSSNKADQSNYITVPSPVTAQPALGWVKDQTSASTVKVSQLELNKSRTIMLQGVVNELSVDKTIEAINKLNKSKGDIYLLLDSPGGSVFDGAKLISAMEASKNKVNTVCVGLCASMAAVIHQYGARRLAHNRAILMFHPAAGGLQGPVPGMVSMLTFITRFTGKIDAHIIARSRLTPEKYAELVGKDLWIDSEDAAALGLVDELVATDYDQIPQELPFGDRLKHTGKDDDAEARKVGTVEFTF